MAAVMLPALPLLLLIFPVLPQVLLQAVVPAYFVGAIPAALTGAYVAVISRLMPPPAPVSFYVASTAFGSCASFLVAVLISTPGIPSQAVGMTTFAGALATLVCVRVASKRILKRQQAR